MIFFTRNIEESYILTTAVVYIKKYMQHSKDSRQTEMFHKALILNHFFHNDQTQNITTKRKTLQNNTATL